MFCGLASALVLACHVPGQNRRIQTHKILSLFRKRHLGLDREDDLQLMAEGQILQEQLGVASNE
jgi:hypothetical protein